MNNIILYQTNEHIFPNFIGLPAIEIFFMIKIEQKLVLNTIALVFLTAIVGVFLRGSKEYRLKIRNYKFISK